MLAHRIAERLVAPLTVDRPFGHWTQSLPPPVRRYPPGSIRRVCRNGVRFTLDLSDWPQYSQFWGWQHRDQEEIVALVPEGAVVLDVGANIGAVALRAAQKARRVYAFEANPATYARLAENVRQNDLPVTPVHAAVSDRRGQLYSRPAQGSRNTGMAEVAPTPSGPPVPAVCLDDFVTERNLTVGLLKVDVEGHDAAVLRGALAMLRRDRPIVVVEVNDEHLCRHGSSSREVLDLFGGLGYSVGPLPGQEVGHDFDAVCRPAH